MFKQKRSLREIERVIDCPRHMISWMFKRDGLMKRTPRPDEGKIVEDFKNGMTMKDAYKKYTGLNRNIADEIKVVYSIQQNQNRYNYDTSSLINDCEFKYYLLGYIYSDGCLDGNSLRFGCMNGDRDILDKINDTVCISEHKSEKIEFHECNPNSLFLRYEMKDVTDYYKEEYGLIERKSLTCKFPNNIPKKYMKDFLRGLFDGDGGIHSSGIISMSGTHDIVSKFTSIIRENVEINYGSRIYESANIFQVRFTSRRDVIKILKYLYNDATIYIDRKYELFKNYENKHGVLG